MLVGLFSIFSCLTCALNFDIYLDNGIKKTRLIDYYRTWHESEECAVFFTVQVVATKYLYTFPIHRNIGYINICG